MFFKIRHCPKSASHYQGPLNTEDTIETSYEGSKNKVLYHQ